MPFDEVSTSIDTLDNAVYDLAVGLLSDQELKGTMCSTIAGPGRSCTGVSPAKTLPNRSTLKALTRSVNASDIAKDDRSSVTSI